MTILQPGDIASAIEDLESDVEDLGKITLRNNNRHKVTLKLLVRRGKRITQLTKRVEALEQELSQLKAAVSHFMPTG